MNASLAPIDRRLERADEHIQTIHREMGLAFVEYETYGITLEYDIETHEHAWWLNVHKSPDHIRWGVLVGDAVHQMRAALDNLAYQLSLITTRGVHVPGTAFPVFTDPEQWAQVYGPAHPKAGKHTSASGEFKLRKAPDLAKARIKCLQPYEGMATMNGFAEGKQTDHRIRRSLFILEKFWNMDKHRVPATAMATAFVAPEGTSGVAYSGTSIISGIPVTFAYKTPFEDRTKLAWFKPPPTGHHMKMNGEFRPHVLFEEGGPGDDQSVRSTLQTCLADVRAVVEEFRALF